MEQTKYDVFISYSRKDYVDEQKNEIPGNVISVIKDTLHQHNISYWMDEEGNLTGKKFAHVIASKIRESLVFLFVCSHNSVASRWVDRELSVADTLDKHIVPFICDDSFKDDRVIMFTASLDRVEYYTNPPKELEKLISTIEKDKKELERKRKEEEEIRLKKQQEEEERIRRQEEEAKKAKAKEEILVYAEDCQRLMVQQETIVQQLINKNVYVGHEYKACPICNNSVHIGRRYCEKCGWQFPVLYSLDGNENYDLDEIQLSVARTNWQSLERVVELQHACISLQKDKSELLDKNSELTDTYDEISKRIKEQTECLEKKDCEIDALRNDLKAKDIELLELVEKEKGLSKKDEEYARIIEEYEQQLNTLGKEIHLREQENQKLAAQITKLLNERKVVESQEENERSIKGTSHIRLNKVTKEFNIGLQTAVEFLQKKGFSEVEANPNYKITEEQYVLMQNWFSSNRGQLNDSSRPIQQNSSQDANLTRKSNKVIKTTEEVFAIIEGCCDRSPIQDGFDFNKAKLNLGRLKDTLSKKYDVYISKTAIIACKNIGELKHLILQYSNKP